MRFRPDSSPFDEGFRAGTVTSLTTTYAQAIEEQARRTGGDYSDVMEDAIDHGVTDFAFPLVLADAVPGRQPQMEFVCHPSFCEVIGAPRYQPN